MTSLELPVLSLYDVVVLLGMVVPIELEDAAEAAVDAARSTADDTVLIAPPLADRYPTVSAGRDHRAGRPDARRRPAGRRHRR